MKYQHLVFYDGQCGMCDRVVQFLLKADKKEIFAFAPLQGKTAEVLLKDLPQVMKSVDSLVLIQDFQTENKTYYVSGKGALRIAWLLGGWWSCLGVFSFLPGIFYNWVYSLIAANRHRIFSSTVCKLPDPLQKDRFLT